MRSATQGEKAAIVQELHKEGYKLNDLLDVIGLSRSTYYYELGRTDKVKERNAELSSEISTIFNENKKIRRETGTTDAKHFVTIAEMPAVRKVIESEEEDEWTAKEWAKMAAGIVCLCSSVKVLEASAEIVKNCRVLDAYAEGSADFDVLIRFTVFVNDDSFVVGGVYLSDLWAASADNREETIKRMFIRWFKEVC